MSREALKQGCTLFAFQPDEDRLSSRGKLWSEEPISGRVKIASPRGLEAYAGDLVLRLAA